jgi:hypothetical protein
MRGSLAWFTVQQPGGTLSHEMIESLMRTDAHVTKVRTELAATIGAIKETRLPD